MRVAVLSCIALLAAWANAQTITTTDAQGNTIVEAITVDPILGATSTTILQTLAPAIITTSTTTPTTTTTTEPVDQGPVGQPAPTGAATPTIFTYTTTDANGVTTAVIDTFTPSFIQSAQSPVLSTGTILDYSQWLSIVGTNTNNAQAAQATSGQLPLLPSGWYGVLGAAASCVVSGAWLVF